MGYFNDCLPDQRFSSRGECASIYGIGGVLWVVHDWDQRRTISVATSWLEKDEDFIFETLAEHIDDIPPNAVLVEVGHEGELITCSFDINDDRTLIPFYPSAAEFASDVPRIRRSHLVELDRMGVQVDLATNTSDNSLVAFKYTLVKENVAVIWHEINCLLRIPKHPNIVSLDSIVVDAVGGIDKVVGFITPFVSGGTVADNLSRPFKLTHLQQLMKVVDYLNLELGIVHGDIWSHNLLIDPATDDLQIFDFNLASRIGSEGDPQKPTAFRYEADRNDVKYTVFTMYEIITRDMHFREENYPEELDASMVTNLDPWEKHPQVCLDAEVAEYRRLLDAWVDTRRKLDADMTHWSQARSPIDWPCLPEFPSIFWMGAMTRRPCELRQNMIRSGADFLSWQRVPSRELPLPAGQQLLSTGQVVDDAQVPRVLDAGSGRNVSQ